MGYPQQRGPAARPDLDDIEALQEALGLMEAAAELVYNSGAERAFEAVDHAKDVVQKALIKANEIWASREGYE